MLASANDLLPAAALVAPGLVGVRRALTRLLGQPIGLSGSGPTLWTLYPSLGDAEAAARPSRRPSAEGTMPTIGDGPPSIIATTIRTTGHEGEPHDAPGHLDHERAGGRRALQPGDRGRRPGLLRRPGRRSTRRPARSGRHRRGGDRAGRCATSAPCWMRRASASRTWSKTTVFLADMGDFAGDERGVCDGSSPIRRPRARPSRSAALPRRGQGRDRGHRTPSVSGAIR